MSHLIRTALKIILTLAVLALGACATVTQNERTAKIDPFEGTNRAIFSFNEGLDKHVMKPVAETYQKVLPNPIRQGVTNFFGNIGDIFTAANNLLQGKPSDALNDAARVLINTTIGILGLFDVASDAGLEKHKEDFGQTLGVWGFETGPYLVLPVFGPRNIRDAAGLSVDWTTNFVLNSGTLSANQKVAVDSLYVIDNRAQDLGATDLLDEAAIDKYSFVRDSYLQRRRYLVRDGNLPPPKDE